MDMAEIRIYASYFNFVIFIILCVSEESDSLNKCRIAGNQDGDLDVFRNHCFLFQPDVKSWISASLACKHKGGNLVDIPDEATQRFVVSRMRRFRFPKAWIGANDRRTEGQWVWTAGTKVEYSNWGSYIRRKRFLVDTFHAIGNKIHDTFNSLKNTARDTLLKLPNQMEDCAYVKMSDRGRWHDAPCSFHSFKFPYICQFDMIPTTVTTSQTATSTQTWSSSATDIEPSASFSPKHPDHYPSPHEQSPPSRRHSTASSSTSRSRGRTTSNSHDCHGALCSNTQWKTEELTHRTSPSLSFHKSSTLYSGHVASEQLLTSKSSASSSKRISLSWKTQVSGLKYLSTTSYPKHKAKPTHRFVPPSLVSLSLHTRQPAGSIKPVVELTSQTIRPTNKKQLPVESQTSQAGRPMNIPVSQTLQTHRPMDTKTSTEGRHPLHSNSDTSAKLPSKYYSSFVKSYTVSSFSDLTSHGGSTSHDGQKQATSYSEISNELSELPERPTRVTSADQDVKGSVESYERFKEHNGVKKTSTTMTLPLIDESGLWLSNMEHVFEHYASQSTRTSIQDTTHRESDFKEQKTFFTEELIIGLSVGAAIALILAIVLMVIFKRRRPNKESDYEAMAFDNQFYATSTTTAASASVRDSVNSIYATPSDVMDETRT